MDDGRGATVLGWGISGSSIDGRPGLQALLAAAEQTPRPIDVLLVDDSSRVSRDTADAIRIMQRLKFCGIRVIYISQNFDSANEQAETLVAVRGMVDSLYLREMVTKIQTWPCGLALARVRDEWQDLRVSYGSSS